MHIKNESTNETNPSSYGYFVSISGPFSVIRIVCSNCALKEPSSATAVQLSSRILGDQQRASTRTYLNFVEPVHTTGSTVKTKPGVRTPGKRFLTWKMYLFIKVSKKLFHLSYGVV